MAASNSVAAKYYRVNTAALVLSKSQQFGRHSQSSIPNGENGKRTKIGKSHFTEAGGLIEPTEGNRKGLASKQKRMQNGSSSKNALRRSFESKKFLTIQGFPSILITTILRFPTH